MGARKRACGLLGFSSTESDDSYMFLLRYWGDNHDAYLDWLKAEDQSGLAGVKRISALVQDAYEGEGIWVQLLCSRALHSGDIARPSRFNASVMHVISIPIQSPK